MGELLINSNIKFSIRLNNFQIERGKRSIKILNKYFPEAIEEIKGVTDKINYNFELFASWIMCMVFDDTHGFLSPEVDKIR